MTSRVGGWRYGEGGGVVAEGVREGGMFLYLVAPTCGDGSGLRDAVGGIGGGVGM